MYNYVTGFVFNESKTKVLLILKQKPDWQAGKYNAIGGKIEDGETPEAAMRRECLEEVGLDIPTWNKFTELRDGRGWWIHFFWATADLNQARQIENEEPKSFFVWDLPQNIIPNLAWLIPMALSMPKERAKSFVITEFY